LPEVFLKYPALVNDLGRVYQYAASGNDGLEQFLQWEKSLAAEHAELRFRLLFFAARIARQRGLIEQSISLFLQALPFAPDSGQADACIWYILDSSFSQGTDTFIQQLEQLIPEWHDAAYFNDVLDKLSRELVIKRDWKKMIRVFGLLQNQNNAVSKAQYAWIIGRAIEEGYLTNEEKRQAAEVLNAFSATTPRALPNGILICWKKNSPRRNCANWQGPSQTPACIRNPCAWLVYTQTGKAIRLPDGIWNIYTRSLSVNWLRSTRMKPTLSRPCCTALSAPRAPFKAALFPARGQLV